MGKPIHDRVAAQLGVADRDLRQGPRAEMIRGHFRYKDKIFAEVRINKRARCHLTKLAIKPRTKAWVHCYRVRPEDGAIVCVNRHSDWHVLSHAAVRQLLEGIGRRIESPPVQPAPAPDRVAACPEQ